MHKAMCSWIQLCLKLALSMDFQIHELVGSLFC